MSIDDNTTKAISVEDGDIFRHWGISHFFVLFMFAIAIIIVACCVSRCIKLPRCLRRPTLAEQYEKVKLRNEQSAMVRRQLKARIRLLERNKNKPQKVEPRPVLKKYPTSGDLVDDLKQVEIDNGESKNNRELHFNGVYLIEENVHHAEVIHDPENGLKLEEEIDNAGVELDQETVAKQICEQFNDLSDRGYQNMIREFRNGDERGVSDGQEDEIQPENLDVEDIIIELGPGESLNSFIENGIIIVDEEDEEGDNIMETLI